MFVYRDINVDPFKLYFLDIFEHGDWSRKKTLEIMHNNWKEALTHYRLDSINNIEPNFSEEAHLKLRNENTNLLIKLSDRSIYMPPGGGLTTMGTNSLAIMTSLSYMRYFHDLEGNIVKKFNTKPENLKLHLATHRLHILLKNSNFLSKKARTIPLLILLKDYLLYFLPLRNLSYLS
ncbi:MAG: hypothetical protein C6H99_04660 [Epsilonproteobacteria bacterium]|nr:hypothetical protein [Campylobacterota bacterium]NPA65008.1 hypothetical protein [Campylobacterota bacterium]